MHDCSSGRRDSSGIKKPLGTFPLLEISNLVYFPLPPKNDATAIPIIVNRIAITRNMLMLGNSDLVVASQFLQAFPCVALAKEPTPLINTEPIKIAAIAKNIGNIIIVFISAKGLPPTYTQLAYSIGL